MASTLFMRNARRSFMTQRFYSVAAEAPSIRQQLTDGVKTAMKAKDLFRTTLLRSVLSEVYMADKEKGNITSPAIILIMRKAVSKRNEAIAQYKQGGRDDLAEKEAREVQVLESLLPPLLSQEELDARLRAAITDSGVQDVKKGTGMILKTFYAAVDRSDVDSAVVKQRLDAIAATM